MKQFKDSDSFLSNEFFEDSPGRGVQCKGGGGGGGGDSEVTNRPFPAQEKALTKLFTRAESEFNRGPDRFFPQNQLAGEDPNTLAARESALAQVGNFDALGADFLGGARSGIAASQFGTPEFEAQADLLANPILDQFRETILPGISNTAASQGAFGGSRQGVQEAQASGEVADALAQSRIGLFREGQQNLSRLLALSPQLQQTQLAGSNLQGRVGAQIQNRRQQEIDAARERFQFNQEAPERALDRLAGRVSGVDIGGITSTTGTGGGGFGFSGAGLIGGAASGFALGGKIGAAGGPIGALGGAVGGAILGGFF